MFSKTYAAAIRGIDALLVQVEADISDGLPGLELVGFLASELREAKERVRVAIRNTGIVLPPKKITVNLSPADVRKEGTAFDLAIAIAILTASGHISEEYIKQTMFIGELSLDGRLNPVNGILPIACCAKENTMLQLIVPQENRAEASVTGELDVWGCRTLREVLELLRGKPPACVQEEVKQSAGSSLPDFSEICGQRAAKRAIEIAVSGGHNLLFQGSPGSGKTMLAKCIPSIMPELTMEESLELSKIYSVSGRIAPGGGLMKRRPFQAPHHTITASAMAGGGRNPKPGEISLATHGVLFLDELPEFERRTIELLRQPLEERRITVNRVADRCDYPASFMLVAAMNPCPCGAYPDRKLCRCSETLIRRYQSRVSRAILDRIDLFLQVAPVRYEELQQKGERECSAAIRERVTRTRNVQQKRYEGIGIRTNAELSAKQLSEFCALSADGEAIMKEAFFRYDFSARAYHRMIKVARTIADMEGAEAIGAEHLYEAIGYRNGIRQLRNS